MRELLEGAGGERLALGDYRKDFGQHFWQVQPPGFWKLERRQTFQEANSASWEAFREGHWDRALELVEARRVELQDYYRKIKEAGFSTWRVRVVEKPISPYLQWELHLLRLRDQTGGKVRVVDSKEVAQYEKRGRLPELVTLGTSLMYELLYDSAGLIAGGVRFVDRDLVGRCQKFIQDLYSVGEDVEDFFNREVADLEPPQISAIHANERAG